MASGAADRLDVTTWIPSARNAQAQRSGWEAAGVAARAGNSAQDRFGAALSAAQARDDAATARARAADQRDIAASARARQADLRDQADAARLAGDRARDAALQTEARVADKRVSLAKPADAPASAARAEGSLSAAGARAEAPKAGAARTAETGRTGAAGQQDSEAVAAGQDPAAEAAGTAGPEADAAVPTQKAEAPAQPAASGPSASLLALIAALSEGGGATGTVKTEAEAETDAGTGTAPAQDGSAALSGTGAAAGPSGTNTQGGDRAAGTVPSIAGTATASAGAGHEPGKVGPGSVPVDGLTAGGAAAATSDAAAQDFLTALTDVGQGAGPLQTLPAAAQGGPAPPATSGQVVDTTRAAQETAAPTQTASLQTDPPIPIGQVPMTIGLRSLRGSNEFQIRLDPAELGRIDVKLEIDKAHGRVMTHLVVDRPETLALLQRDAGQLQQALTQAGFDPSAGGINLSLRGDGSAQSGGSGGQPGDSPRGGGTGWSRDQAEAPHEVAPIRVLRGYGGLDMRI
ncbi:flagellar hook-length control protein [Methylobacterium sp. Leaf361]|uniref:flagellar hook-length control protein FliK n=1 Tax=Methylobacterium sp. Leaf361 TaxID=1736352 RepID=UPI000701C357|nr:flagellar hook-length control protein FliK [Methylobacterium sp. Leaf361]KQS67105.1 flagellar hook-length control protein [Methylobacterium sp. Leaf361]